MPDSLGFGTLESSVQTINIGGNYTRWVISPHKFEPNFKRWQFVYTFVYHITNMESVDLKLRERIKELKCLYALSKVAWEADNDLSAIVSKTLEILPKAMQYQALAEASITVNGKTYSSSNFGKCKHVIDSAFKVDSKNFGKVQIGYRTDGRKHDVKPAFLQEEKNLLKAVSRELSLFIKRASVEADKEHLQIQLQHVERLAFVGELSAGIAHELNEPLGRILGFAQLIKKAGNLNDQQREDVERIVKASLYTREIIKKLMIFSRQMPRQITNVNLNQIVESILYFIDVRFHSRGVKISTNLDEDLQNIQADEVQMSQVLVNLITNAIHAMPNGGEVIISTKNKSKQISLVVRDNGTGMTKEVKDKIFEPFFTTKAVGHGTGLGLSVVQGIIDSHKGRISVTTAPGKGSKFEIVLPREQR
jgi:two-component system, NtrC family, sensor kinase